MTTGKKTGAPVGVVKDLSTRRAFADGSHHGKGGEVFVHASQTVTQPGTGGRASGELIAAEEKVNGGSVIYLLGVHALDEAYVVGDLPGVRHEVADPGAAFAILLVGLDGREELSFVGGGRHRAETFAFHVTGRDGLSVAFFEFRLVVEKLEVGRTAVLEKKDDAFGFWRDSFDGGGQFGVIGLRFLTEQRSKRGNTDAGGAFAKELASVDVVLTFEKRVHLFFSQGFVGIEKGKARKIFRKNCASYSSYYK